MLDSFRMNIRKHIVSAIAFIAIASSSLLFAQPAPGGPGGPGGGRGGRGGRNPEMQVNRIDEAVSLTAEQKPKVLAIFTKLAADVQAVPFDQEGQAKRASLRDAANKEVRALLTPAQQAKFDAMPPPPARGGGR